VTIKNPRDLQTNETVERRLEIRLFDSVRASRSFTPGLLLFAGVALCAFLVWRSGPELIGSLLFQIGWVGLLMVIVPHALVIVFEALGWWFAFPRNGCPIKPMKIVRFVVVAKAIQLITPSISQAGELLKIQLLRLTGVMSEISVASVIASKTTITLAELLFLSLGFAAIFTYVTVEPALVASAIVGILMMFIVVAAIITWQRMGIFRPFVLLSRRLGMLTAFCDRHEQFMFDTDSLLRGHLTKTFGFWLSGFGYFLAWLSGALEAWVFLSLLGLTSDFLSALLVQVWLVLVTRVTAFIPGNMGAHEAGIVMVSTFLGLGADGAMAFALLRRFRQIVWIALGLGLMAKMSRAQRFPFSG
jgi:uncharacterized protein (TIRG00374 family)